ncbi:MAG: hypothetical protein AAFN59_08860 [Pseudomonadota bacterium]
MSESKSSSAKTPAWAYLIAAVLGSLVGAILDATLYSDGGSMLMKIGFVVGPLCLYLARRGRSKDAE